MAEAVESLIWEVRRCFRELAVAADTALEPLGLTASDRALIEFLARESEPISLAALARKRSVSRQHVHQSLARLPDPRWVEKAADPKDTRSVLLRLTGEGRSVWKEIRRVDRALLARIARQVDPAKVRAATTTLQDIRHLIRGHDHD